LVPATHEKTKLDGCKQLLVDIYIILQTIARDKIATSQYLMSIVTMVFLGVVASCGVGDTPRVI
jgi:hypothetical protein